jgi:hypothetical protein
VSSTAQATANQLLQQAEQGRQRVAQGMVGLQQEVTRAASNPFETLNRAADQLGGGVRNAGRLIEQGGQALQGHVPFAQDLINVGRGAQQLGRGIQDAPEAAVSTAREIERGVGELRQGAQELLQRAEQTVDRTIQGVEKGLQDIRDGIGRMGDSITNFGRQVGDAVNYNRQIDQLGDGDKFTLGVGASGSVEGAKVYGKGQIEIERKGNQYVVSVDGELGGGLYAELGGKLGPAKASGTAEATLGAGGRVEMTFNSPEEAKRATEILLRQAAASAAGAATSSIAVPGSGIAGRAVEAAMRPSAEEMRFLAQNTSAIELRGNVAAELAGSLGVADKQTQLAGLFGKGQVKQEMAARIEFRPNGAHEIAFRETISGEISAGGGLGVMGTNGQNGASTGIGLGGSVKGSVTNERRFTLPANLDSAEILRDPMNSLRGIGSQIAATEQGKVTVQLDAEGQAAGNARGIQAKLEFTGQPDFIIRSGAIQTAMQGDLNGALRQVGDQVHVKATVTPYQNSGINLSPGVSFMGFGVGLEGRAIRQDMADKPLWSFEGNATQAAEGIGQGLERGMRYIQENPEVILARSAQNQYLLRG